MGECYKCSIYCLAIFGALDSLFLVPGSRFCSLVSKQVGLIFVSLFCFVFNWDFLAQGEIFWESVRFNEETVQKCIFIGQYLIYEGCHALGAGTLTAWAQHCGVQPLSWGWPGTCLKPSTGHLGLSWHSFKPACVSTLKSLVPAAPLCLLETGMKGTMSLLPPVLGTGQKPSVPLRALCVSCCGHQA